MCSQYPALHLLLQQEAHVDGVLSTAAFWNMRIAQEATTPADLDRLYAEFQASGVGPDRDTFHVLLKKFGDCGQLERMERLAEASRRKHGVWSRKECGALIAVYRNYRMNDKVDDVLDYMRRVGIPTDFKLRQVLLEWYTSQGDQVAVMREVDAARSRRQLSALLKPILKALAIFGKVDEMEAVWDDVDRRKTVEEYETLMEVYRTSGRVDDLERLQEEMREAGLGHTKRPHSQRSSVIQVRKAGVLPGRWPVEVAPLGEEIEHTLRVGGEGAGDKFLVALHRLVYDIASLTSLLVQDRAGAHLSALTLLALNDHPEIIDRLIAELGDWVLSPFVHTPLLRGVLLHHAQEEHWLDVFDIAVDAVVSAPHWRGPQVLRVVHEVLREVFVGAEQIDEDMMEEVEEWLQRCKPFAPTHRLFQCLIAGSPAPRVVAQLERRARQEGLSAMTAGVFTALIGQWTTLPKKVAGLEKEMTRLGIPRTAGTYGALLDAAVCNGDRSWVDALLSDAQQEGLENHPSILLIRARHQHAGWNVTEDDLPITWRPWFQQEVAAERWTLPGPIRLEPEPPDHGDLSVPSPSDPKDEPHEEIRIAV